MTDAVQHLSIDIETYSDVDLSKAGLYRYVQSPAFEILLIAYSLNNAPVQVVDIASGEQVPSRLFSALFSSRTVKHAFNAAFEWQCLSKGFRLTERESVNWLRQWRCTMLHARYCGYPGSLEAAGAALGLSEDQKKQATGKALISYFCKPCAPTRSNGYRSRNLPVHDPAKWELFKTYNAQDVTAEMEIERRLSAFPVPADVQEQWITDQIINLRGVAVDTDLVNGALEINSERREELTEEARDITKLDNPNSGPQLTGWLESRLGESIPDIRKDTVEELLERADLKADARRMLEIRRELNKTSNAKYGALAESVCADGRVRGLLQFYGANRTGRWCLTGDHEILTPEGWARLDAWRGGQILCWNSTTEVYSFQKSNSLCFDYAGKMIQYKGQRCEQIATPEHKMPILNKQGLWEAESVEDIGKRRFTIPFTGKRTRDIVTDRNHLRVLIMTQADGHYTDESDLRFHLKKRRKIDRCKFLLRQSGITFVERENGDSSVTITIKARFVPLWLRQFKNKRFGYWLLDESPEVLFDELPKWDGYRCGPNSIQYVTTIEQNADVIQACAVCAGLSATKILKCRDNGDWTDAWILNIWLSPGHGTSIRREQVSEMYYRGPVYCAETPTGYFAVRRNGKVWVTGNSGRIVQPQNLPRTYIKASMLPLARNLVKLKNKDCLELVFGSVSDSLSQLIRTALVAASGHTLIDADFSAIEARLIAWLAGEEWALEVFRTHGKIYEAAAAQMFKVPIEKIKKGNPEYSYRQRGKVATLALGYGGGAGAMVKQGALKIGLTEDELPDIVSRWRGENPHIVQFWSTVEAAAREAVNQGRLVELWNGRLAFARECDLHNDFLTIRLPSGRKLYYVKPHMGRDNRGRASLCYMGLDDKKSWSVVSTWGGKLAENITQAVARDCLAFALENLENAGFPIVFHVHDECVAEIPDGSENDLKRMVSIMSRTPPWAPGLPLNADGWVNPFFKKD